MYKVKNLSLSSELAELGVKSLRELSEDDLFDFCVNTLKINPVFRPPKKQGQPATELDKLKTIAMINGAFTYSEHMSFEFWNTSHREQAEASGLLNEIKDHTHGDQSYELYAQVKFGFFKLAPGQEAELDVSKSWVQGYLMERPTVVNGNIVVSEGDKILKPAALIEAEKTPYDALSFEQLKKLATPFAKTKTALKGKTREDLINLLVKETA